MKKYIITLLVLATFNLTTQGQELAFNGNPSESTTTDVTTAPSFAWSLGTTHDFGKIKQNIPATKVFTFTNNGKTPLVITNVKGSCGCTVTAYSKEAIPPGQEGTVTATYNAKKVGAFTKSVTVFSNTAEGTVKLFIKGEVTP